MQTRSFRSLPGLIVLTGCSLSFAIGTSLAANWPAWRGPEGTGVSSEKNLPLRWSTNENVRWRTGLPDRGNSTPIIWGNRVFLTQAIEKERHRVLICFERKTGKLLWQAGPTVNESEPTHKTNPQCSGSPVTDGQRVIAWFGSAGLYCFDLEGKELWRRQLGPQRHIWGWGASPMLYRDLCILNFGPGEPSFLLAVNKQTGKDAWKLVEPNADSGEKKPGQDKAVWTGSWNTPVVIRANRRDALAVAWPKRLLAIEPATGKELWSCAGLNPLVYTSPLYDAKTETVVAMGGFNGMALAAKAGGSGDVTESHRLWHHPKTKQRIGSGVIHNGHIYILNDPGVAECFELQTGKLVWEERLKGPAPKSDSWSSMVLAGEKLYVINQGGDAFVLKASPKFEVLATNSLGETAMSSIAPSNGELFIRTHKALWCISEKAK